MTELRPLLAVVGLLVVAVAIVIWIARLRGWRVEWWERFLSPGGGRGSRTAPEDAAGSRARRGGRRGSTRSAASTETRPGRRDRAESGRRESDRAGAESGRQALIDLGDLPLFNPGGRARADSLEQEFDVGDLGALETEPQDDVPEVRAPSHAPSERPADPAPSRARANPESVRERGRPHAPEPRRREVNEEPRAVRQAPSRSEGEVRDLLVVLTVLTADERDLPGSLVRDALAAFDLQPDGQGMFHHFGNRHGTASEPVFSVANVLEPGVFDLDAMDDISTPGLCIFLRRPGPLPARVSFDLMLDVATRLSRALEATLCDDQRCRLTVQATQALRERVIHFALRHERGMPDVR